MDTYRDIEPSPKRLIAKKVDTSVAILVITHEFISSLYLECNDKRVLD